MFHCLFSLLRKRLDLSYCQIASVTGNGASNLGGTNNLGDCAVKLNNNKISTITGNPLKVSGRSGLGISTLDLSSNLFTTLDTSKIVLDSANYGSELNLANNQITQIEGSGPIVLGYKKSGSATLRLERNNLTVLDVSKLPNLGPSSALAFQVRIFASNNAITQITNAPLNLTSSDSGYVLLDLSYNAFTSFDGGWVSMTIGTTTSFSGNLTLSHNQISTITNPPLKSASSAGANSKLLFIILCMVIIRKLYVNVMNELFVAFIGLVALDYNKLTSISGSWFQTSNSSNSDLTPKSTFSFTNNNMTSVTNGGSSFTINDGRDVTLIFDQNNFTTFDPAWFTFAGGSGQTTILSFRENQISQFQPNIIGSSSNLPNYIILDLSSNPFTLLNQTALTPFLTQLSNLLSGFILFYNTGNDNSSFA